MLPKILVIIGPTASGKTSLSIKLTKTFNGEVISADSRQVYKGLDLGTGKVTPEEMAGIPHHLLDVADPHDTYTVADFVRDADSAISDITSRGKLPIIAGGTFLYVDTLLGKMSAPDVPPNDALRAELEALDTTTLAEKLAKLDPVRHKNVDIHNRRRLVRAIEIAEALGSVPASKKEDRFNALTLGIHIEKDALAENIHKRLITRLEAGMIHEVQTLHERGLSYERLGELGIEYKYIGEYLQGNISHEEMCLQIETKSQQFAKRQMTWLKRDTEIVWVRPGDVEEAEKLVENFLK